MKLDQRIEFELHDFPVETLAFASSYEGPPRRRGPLVSLHDLVEMLLLAPTGALVLMIVRDISEAANPLFQNLSIYAFLYCYKCHSKSLKQYQCN